MHSLACSVLSAVVEFREGQRNTREEIVFIVRGVSVQTKMCKDKETGKRIVDRGGMGNVVRSVQANRH